MAMVADVVPLITAEQGSAEWWRDRLLKELSERSKLVDLCEAYYDGNHPLPGPPKTLSNWGEAERAFRTLSKMGVTNYVKLVPDAPAERLEVVGFRFSDATSGDGRAWALWQDNELDADSGVLHHSTITVGNGFALVWPDPAGPSTTVEHASQAIVAYAPGSRRRRAAGLKCWCEDDGTRRVVLYLPDNVCKWRTVTQEGPLVEWQPATDDTWPIKNPFAAMPNPVPLVEFRANPSLKPAMYGGGRPDFAGVLSIQDRINKTIFDRLVTAEFQAFRQRYAIGWTPENPNQAMQASMKHLLTFEDGDVKVGEFAQADFTGFLKAVEADVQAMAAITRTPTFYTLGVIANVAAEGFAAMQSGLVARTTAHRNSFTESWEDVMRLMLFAARNKGWKDRQSQMIWADIEHRTMAEKADAAVKMQAVGVPQEALWERLGASPQEIDRWKVMQADQALFAPQPAPVNGNA